MPTLADIRPYVFKYTDRPDLETETDAAITSALVSSHLHKDYSPFHFDLFEYIYQAPDVTEETVLSLTLPDRFRAPIKYCHSEEARLEYVPPSALFDPNTLLAKTNLYYLAGANLNVRLAAATEKIYLGYYKLPSIVDSWIAINMPECIALKAASTIAASVTNEARARTFNALWDEQMRVIHASAFDL